MRIIMCRTIIFNGKEYSTVKQLSEIAKIIIRNDNYPDIDESLCLCQIDIDKTAKRNNFLSEEMEFDYVWRKF